MASYEDLKNHQAELIRKALKGSMFIAPADATAIGDLTSYNTASSAAVVGTSAAVNIVTGGNLVVSVDGGANVTTALASADTPSQCVTKINTALGVAATASLVASKLTITSASTGVTSSVTVVSGTGTVLANLFLGAAQTDSGEAAHIGLVVLPEGWDDLGLLSSDGVGVANDVSASDVTSWGHTSPTRSDVMTDSSTLTVNCQETKLGTIGLYTGQDMSLVTPAALSGEVRISKPARPSSRYYRGLLLAVDEADEGEIFIARYFPRIKVTGKSDQAMGGGDDPISWGVTMQTYADDAAGYSERWLFGGTGWQAKLAAMGFAA